jgi:hypothetical protein
MYSDFQTRPVDALGTFGTVRKLARPTHVLSQVWRNLSHLRPVLGEPIFALFLLSLLASSIALAAGRGRLEDHTLFIFLLTYIVGLSFVTSTLQRYVAVLVPIALAQIAVAASVILAGLRIAERTKRRAGWFLAAALMILGLSTQPDFRQVNFRPSISGQLPSVRAMSAHVRGEPVFAVTPLWAYMVGGVHHTMPNDDLDKIVTYGRHTGVRWLVHTRDQSVMSEARLLTNAGWYVEAGESNRELPDLELTASSETGLVRLYRIP